MKKLTLQKPDFTKLGSFGCNLLGAFLSVIVAFVFAFPFGIGYAIDWVTDLILYTVIIEVALDFVTKLHEGGKKFCWEYFVGIVLVLLTDWSFMAAAHQTENLLFGRWCAIVAVGIIGSAVWFCIPVKKKYAKLGG